MSRAWNDPPDPEEPDMEAIAALVVVHDRVRYRVATATPLMRAETCALHVPHLVTEWHMLYRSPTGRYFLVYQYRMGGSRYPPILSPLDADAAYTLFERSQRLDETAWVVPFDEAFPDITITEA